MEGDFKIDFIGVGSPRAGTTWLATCLAEHPQICLSTPTETYFFSKDYEFKKGVQYYKKFFNNCQKDALKGEFGRFYYLDEKAVAKIKESFPEVKILIILRNPVEQAFSTYNYRKNKGRESAISFEEALKNNNEYCNWGLYYKHLSKFLFNFKHENIQIILYEDIFSNPKHHIKKVFQFLRVDENFIPPSLRQKINAAEDINFKILAINKVVDKRKSIKKNAPGRAIIKALKFLGINKIVQLVLRLNTSPQQVKISNINKQARQKLYNEFKDDIAKLEKLINKDLSFWK